MSELTASSGDNPELERFELMIAALVFGSVVGALVYFSTTGQRYEVGDTRILQNPLTWIGVAGRLWFSFLSRLRLARLGWRTGVALAILTIMTPLGDPGDAAWGARAVATMAWSGIVAIATGRAVTSGWRTVAILAFSAEVGLRYWSLQNWDHVTGRSTVLWGE